MGTYDTAQICLNGHIATYAYEDHPEYRQDFCDKCGQKTLTACPNCQTKFKGWMRDSPVIGSDPAPAFCYGCGNALPWTATALDAARELVEEAENLSDEEREQLAGSLDDLVQDSPKTEVAARRFKRLAAKAGAETASGLKSVLVSIATEAAKGTIWPP